MAQLIGSLGGAKSFLTEFFASAALSAGQACVAEPTASNIGEAADPSGTTAAADMLGIAEDAATSDTSPTTKPGTLLITQGSLENLVRIDLNPLAIYRFRISGSSTTGDALIPYTATPSNELLNDTADSTAPYALITDTAVGTIDMSGGLLKGSIGNNVGAIRKLISQVNSTSATVGIGFLNAIAANDRYIRVPYSRTCQTMQFTSDFVEANGIIAYGSGAPFRVVNVKIDEERTIAWVDVVAGDHQMNPA